MQGLDAGGNTAVCRTQVGFGPGTTEVKETGGIDAEAGRGDEKDRWTLVPDDT